jgi:hypothetical protein
MSTASVTVYASRSISWDTVTLPSGATFPGGVLIADTVMEERADDDSVITENPVEIGSVVNDHAFDTPQELELIYVWDAVKQAGGQPGFLETTYQKVRDLKRAKIIVNCVTGKAQYQNLLIKGISNVTDRETENILVLRLTLKQLLLTLTQTVIISTAAQQSMPQKTMPTVNGGSVSLQPGQNYNSGTTSGQ